MSRFISAAFAACLLLRCPLSVVAQTKVEGSKAIQAGRPAHPEMPSVARQTPPEMGAVAEIIRLAILDDLTAKVPNAEKVRLAFANLEAEALPQLIEAANLSANNGWTCPSQIMARKIGNLIERHLDRAEFASRHLGKGVVNPNPPETFKDVRQLAKNLVAKHSKEQPRTVTLQRLQELVERFHVASAQDWRDVVQEIGKRKDEGKACGFLITALEKARTAEQREAIHAALKDWSGVDHGPEDYTSQGEAAAAAKRWRSWQEKK